MSKPDWNKGDGLLPAIVQHAENGRVLMLGYMNADALRQTQETGLVTFWSRTRKSLWQKGETSGNTLALISLDLDCDQDTFLIRARPNGPTCHTGAVSCFGSDDPEGIVWLCRLQEIIERRKTVLPEDSYTARLLTGPETRAAQKVGEEGVEVALAAVSGSDDELIDESADLLYHLMVLLSRRDIALQAVALRLKERHEAGPE